MDLVGILPLLIALVMLVGVEICLVRLTKKLNREYKDLRGEALEHVGKSIKHLEEAKQLNEDTRVRMAWMKTHEHQEE